MSEAQRRAACGAPAPAKVAMRTVRGLKMTTIVVAPAGNIFVKCTWPLKTMSVNQPKFEQLLASFQPA